MFEHIGLVVFLLMESVRGQESPFMAIILFGEEKELNHVAVYEHVPLAISCTSANTASVLQSGLGSLVWKYSLQRGFPLCRI